MYYYVIELEDADESIESVIEANDMVGRIVQADSDQEAIEKSYFMVPGHVYQVIEIDLQASERFACEKRLKNVRL